MQNWKDFYLIEEIDSVDYHPLVLMFCESLPKHIIQL